MTDTHTTGDTPAEDETVTRLVEYTEQPERLDARDYRLLVETQEEVIAEQRAKIAELQLQLAEAVRAKIAAELRRSIEGNNDKELIDKLQSKLQWARLAARIDAKERIDWIKTRRENRRHTAMILRMQAEIQQARDDAQDWHRISDGWKRTASILSSRGDSCLNRWRSFAVACNLARRELREALTERELFIECLQWKPSEDER